MPQRSHNRIQSHLFHSDRLQFDSKVKMTSVKTILLMVFGVVAFASAADSEIRLSPIDGNQPCINDKLFCQMIRSGGRTDVPYEFQAQVRQFGK
jgi:hypothetical protein